MSAALCEFPDRVSQNSSCIEASPAHKVADANDSWMGSKPPECGSYPHNGQEIKRGRGGRRAGAGRKPKAPAVVIPVDEGPHWYCCQTLPRNELLAVHRLAVAGFVHHLPIYLARAGGVPDPLFPGYLFVQFDRERDPWRRIPSLPGVKHLFGTDAEHPLPLREGIVEALIRRADELLTPPPVYQPITAGAELRIVNGPFENLSAVCLMSVDARVELLVSLFGRDVKATLNREDVELVSAR